MHLSPQEKDKLLIVTAALLAERRLNRGLKLNHPEAVAWLSFLVLEGARDGKSVAELMQEGTTWLRQDQVMEGVPELVHEVQIEAVFPDADDGKPFFGHDYASGAAASALTAAAARALPPRRPRTVM